MIKWHHSGPGACEQTFVIGWKFSDKHASKIEFSIFPPQVILQQLGGAGAHVVVTNCRLWRPRQENVWKWLPATALVACNKKSPGRDCLVHTHKADIGNFTQKWLPSTHGGPRQPPHTHTRSRKAGNSSRRYSPVSAVQTIWASVCPDSVNLVAVYPDDRKARLELASMCLFYPMPWKVKPREKCVNQLWSSGKCFAFLLKRVIWLHIKCNPLKGSCQWLGLVDFQT